MNYYAAETQMMSGFTDIVANAREFRARLQSREKQQIRELAPSANDEFVKRIASGLAKRQAQIDMDRAAVKRGL